MTGDRFVRRAATRSAERLDGVLRVARRLEAGEAMRWTEPGGAQWLRATSAGSAPALAAADPLALLAAVPAADHVLVETASLESVLHAADRRAVRWSGAATVTVLGVRSARGWLRRSRLEREAKPVELAADLGHLLDARAVAAVAPATEQAGRLWLSAAVAASLLSASWQAWLAQPERPLPESPVVVLADDPTPAGGPLGAPVDGLGRPARRIVLSGPDAEPLAALAPWRTSFAALPEPGAASLRLEPRVAAERIPEDTGQALAVETLDPSGCGIRAVVLVREPDGRPRRLRLELDLAGLLAAVRCAGPTLYRTPAAAAPWLLLEPR